MTTLEDIMMMGVTVLGPVGEEEPIMVDLSFASIVGLAMIALWGIEKLRRKPIPPDFCVVGTLLILADIITPAVSLSNLGLIFIAVGIILVTSSLRRLVRLRRVRRSA